MQDVYRALETHRVHSAIRGAVVVLYNLQDARTLALPRLCGRVFAAELGHAEGRADVIFDRFGELQQIITA